MRVLFTTVATKAHLYAQVPIAWALRAAGHEVCVASHPDLAAEITRTGLTAVGVGEPLDQEGQVRELRKQQAEQGQQTEPLGAQELLTMDELRPEKLTYDYMHGVFTAMTYAIFQNFSSARMMDDLVRFAREWRPDLVVWDALTFAGGVAAKATGAAHARLLSGLDLIGRMRESYLAEMLRRPPELREDPMAEWLGWTLQRHGREFTEDAVVGQWTIDSVQPWMRLPSTLEFVTVRHVPYNGRATIPWWLRQPPRRPRVCITLGVSFREVMGGDQVSVTDLLAAVSGMDIEVIATLNDDQLHGLPAVPDNVRTVDYVSLNELLPSCSAIIHQGGWGTLQTALVHGVPQIVVPTRIWDNPLKAERIEQSGAGLHVADPERLTAADLSGMLRRVLAEPSFAGNAARLRTEMNQAPTPADTVPVLEKLTAEHRIHQW